MRRRVVGVVIAAMVMVAAAGIAVAGDGWAVTHSLAGGSVALTNGQANAVWVPVAVLWVFPGPTDAALSVERVSQGNTFRLGLHSISIGTSAVWVPEGEYSFAEGDVLRVTSSATNGSVQVIRRGG